jgi:hypothetical protein
VAQQCFVHTCTCIFCMRIVSLGSVWRYCHTRNASSPLWYLIQVSYRSFIIRTCKYIHITRTCNLGITPSPNPCHHIRTCNSKTRSSTYTTSISSTLAMAGHFRLIVIMACWSCVVENLFDSYGVINEKEAEVVLASGINSFAIPN